MKNLCLSSQAIVAAAFVAGSLIAPVEAARAGEGPGCVTVQKLTADFVNWNGKADAKFYSQAAQYIDYQTMGQRALGQGQWAKLTAAQRTKYITSLRQLMEKRYYIRWHKIFAKSKLNCLGQSTVAGDSVVKTNLSTKDKNDEIVWRLKADNSKVISMSVGEKDLLQRLSVKLSRRLKRSGIEGVLSWMDKAASAKGSSEDSTETQSITGEPE